MKMSIKIDRINHSIVREISYILMTEVKDEDIKFVTITDCKTTNEAAVFLSCILLSIRTNVPSGSITIK